MTASLEANVTTRSPEGNAWKPDARPPPTSFLLTSSCNRFPVAASQTATLPLLLMVTTLSPPLTTATSNIHAASTNLCSTSQVLAFQMKALLSRPPVTTLSPPGKKAMLEMGAAWALSSQIALPLDAFQIVAHSSEPHTKTLSPVGNTETLLWRKPNLESLGWCSGGDSTCNLSPDVTFQMIRLASPAQVTTRSPSGKTSPQPTGPLCGSSCVLAPVAVSQITATGSMPIVNALSPPGRNRTSSISESCDMLWFEPSAPQMVTVDGSLRAATW
mmetsp:Transcript_12184/g.34823  ORF Transcript_12184/g.34823 Transcript_12184/m.34823 type:complete len:273 (-) Transcript_12184:349-1167(-)